MTKREGAIIGAYTGILCGDFHTLRGYIKEKMGRPVWTHEMADEATMAKIKDAAQADFLALCKSQAATPAPKED